MQAACMPCDGDDFAIVCADSRTRFSRQSCLQTFRVRFCCCSFGLVLYWNFIFLLILMLLLFVLPILHGSWFCCFRLHSMEFSPRALTSFHLAGMYLQQVSEGNSIFSYSVVGTVALPSRSTRIPSLTHQFSTVSIPLPEKVSKVKPTLTWMRSNTTLTIFMTLQMQVKSSKWKQSAIVTVSALSVVCERCLQGYSYQAKIASLATNNLTFILLYCVSPLLLVAVCGLPTIRKDHAVVMARYAYNCLLALRELLHQLEVSLG